MATTERLNSELKRLIDVEQTPLSDSPGRWVYFFNNCVLVFIVFHT
jgi:hypothetical protein